MPFFIVPFSVWSVQHQLLWHAPLTPRPYDHLPDIPPWAVNPILTMKAPLQLGFLGPDLHPLHVPNRVTRCLQRFVVGSRRGSLLTWGWGAGPGSPFVFLWLERCQGQNRAPPSGSFLVCDFCIAFHFSLGVCSYEHCHCHCHWQSLLILSGRRLLVALPM